MTVEITNEDEQLVNRLIRSGTFQNVNEAVHEAIKRLEGMEANTFPYYSGTVYSPGSLAHLYTQEENEKELRLVRTRTPFNQV